MKILVNLGGFRLQLRLTGGQGVNLRRNIWHGVLCPLDGTGLYAVIDRIGEGNNLEEHWLETPVTVTG